jgi:hypothetical protein
MRAVAMLQQLKTKRKIPEWAASLTLQVKTLDV